MRVGASKTDVHQVKVVQHVPATHGKGGNMARTWDPGEAASIVRQIYEIVLERGVDDSGLVHWASALARGERTVRDTVLEIGLSQEYFNRFINEKTSHEAAELMYQHFLGRGHDSQHNLDNHADQIAEDWTVAVRNFVRSAEYASKFGPDSPPKKQ